MSIHEGLHSHLVGTTAKGGNGETVTHSLIYLEAVDPVRSDSTQQAAISSSKKKKRRMRVSKMKHQKPRVYNFMCNLTEIDK